MRQYWLIIERKTNWEVDCKNGFQLFGISSKYQKIASTISKGDILLTYIPHGISAFSDSREVLENGIKPLRRLYDYDTAVSYCIVTQPLIVLEEIKWIPVKDILNELELTRGKRSWNFMFQTTLRPLSDHDGEFLLETMRKQAERKIS